jgi:hypothetical protein
LPPSPPTLTPSGLFPLFPNGEVPLVPIHLLPPLYGALLKNEQDVQLLERLAFMSRRDQTK